MNIKERDISIRKLFWLIIYYSLARYLPDTIVCSKIRAFCCRHIFAQCGTKVRVGRNAYFGSGLDVCIGNRSNIGKNAHIPSNTIIGNFVMMGPGCYILGVNHIYTNTNYPMMYQGLNTLKQTIIEDDVWIGQEVLFTPGRIVRKGSVIAARTVLCKDFEAYSVVGGNPSRFIKCRLS